MVVEESRVGPISGKRRGELAFRAQGKLGRSGQRNLMLDFEKSARS